MQKLCNSMTSNHNKYWMKLIIVSNFKDLSCLKDWTAKQFIVQIMNSKKWMIQSYKLCIFRSANPINGFMIINRLHLNDLIEPINKNLEFQLQDPFLLYRNEKGLCFMKIQLSSFVYWTIYTMRSLIFINLLKLWLLVV